MYLFTDNIKSISIKVLHVLYNVISVIVHGKITQGPSDTTAFIGDSIHFDCELVFDELDIMAWQFENEPVFSYDYGTVQYPAGQTKYSVKESGQRFILYVHDLNFEDGGTYECSTLKSKSYAHLTVLGKFKLMF